MIVVFRNMEIHLNNFGFDFIIFKMRLGIVWYIRGGLRTRRAKSQKSVRPPKGIWNELIKDWIELSFLSIRSKIVVNPITGLKSSLLMFCICKNLLEFFFNWKDQRNIRRFQLLFHIDFPFNFSFYSQFPSSLIYYSSPQISWFVVRVLSLLSNFF